MDMLTKNKDLLDRAMRAEAEVERLRSENLELRVAVLGPDGIRANQEIIIGEQAARIKELEAEVEAKNKQIKELQDIIDKPPEEADWVADYHLLQSALDGPIIDAARKWHAAYRKAQNSNLMREKEVKRLRSANPFDVDVSVAMRVFDDHFVYGLEESTKILQELCDGITSMKARIKELEATKERLQSAPKSGLYGKYIIQKADGSPVDPEADYFILRLDADPVARIAALEYAIQTDDQKLGEMLEKRVMDHVFSKDDQCRKRVEGWPLGQIKRLRKEIAAKDARIKELEGMIKQLGSLAFMADYTPLDQIIAHFMSWGQSNYEYTSRLEVAFLRSNAAMRYYQEGNRGPWPQLGEKFKEPYQEKAREALERIRNGE